MKLSLLYEYLSLASGPNQFYGDPKRKKKNKSKKKKDLSFLVGGTQDRDRFLRKMNKS